MTSDSDAASDHKPKSQGCWGCLALIVVPPVLFAVWLVSNGGDDRPWVATGTQAEAACEKSVRERLKAPATADFDAPVVTPAGSGWLVTGSVDSENSFGALVRSDYTCQATPPASAAGSWQMQITVD